MKAIIKNQFLLLFSLFLIFSGCGNNKIFRQVKMQWRPMEKINQNLPDGIKVYKGKNNILPLKAWYAEVDVSLQNMSIRVVRSQDTDRKETLSEFADNLNASIVVNGGYYILDKHPTDHVGLLMSNNIIYSPAISSVLRGSTRYFLTRSALGIHDDNHIDIAWIASRNDSLYEWHSPVLNQKNIPQSSLDYSQAVPWNVRDALQAGPVLITDGEINITVDEEVFFGSKIPNIHPRTAAGYTSDGRFILMVVDGRQPSSRGVYLQELAFMMDNLDCVEAINLDGGGSSGMVVNGKILNRPTGTTGQREVMSAIAVLFQE